MRTLPKLAGSVAAISLSLSIGSAQAAMYNFTLTGEVIYAASSNVFNLHGQTPDGFGIGIPGTGSTVSVVGIFDDTVLTAGSGTISFNAANNILYGNTFTLTAGDIVFTPGEEVTGGTYPQLTLNAGTINFSDSGLNFYATDTDTGAEINSYFSYFDGNDEFFGGQISGDWLKYSSSLVVVPVPAAVWLLGSGLLGLVGVARRKVSI